MRHGFFLTVALLGGCASRPPTPAPPIAVVAAHNVAPPREPRAGGPKSEHPEAIAHLLDAPWSARIDRRRTVSLPLPDGAAWTHVKYWGVTTLAGYRYGDEHHVALAIFSFSPPKDAKTATVDGCAKRLHDWGMEKATNYDVEISDPRIEEITWPEGSKTKAKIFVVDARRRSILGTKRYAAAYAVYPAWTEACLAVGFAVPEGSAEADARALRDRMVRDALPALTVKANAGALALEARSDVE
jgi:hypothetical protein